MKKLTLFLFAAMLMACFSITAAEPPALTTVMYPNMVPTDFSRSPRKIAKSLTLADTKRWLFYTEYVLVSPGDSLAYSNIAKQILQNGRVTNSAILITNRFEWWHLQQPQAVGAPLNPTICQVIHIISPENNIKANCIRNLMGGSDIPGYFVGYSDLFNPNLIFSNNLIGITRPPGSPAFPHVGHTILTNGFTSETLVGELIYVGFPFRCSTSPPDTTESFFDNYDPYRLWGITDYVEDGVVKAHSRKIIENKPEHGPTAANHWPRVGISLSTTNPAFVLLKGVGDPHNTFVVEQASSIVKTNQTNFTKWVPVATANDGDVLTDSATNKQGIYRLRNL